MKYKVGDRFIVEIAEVLKDGSLVGEGSLYGIKGFNALTFDDFGLDKLPYANNIEAKMRNSYNQINKYADEVHSLNAENNELKDKLKKKSEDLACQKILVAVRESQIEDLKKEINGLKNQVKNQKIATGLWIHVSKANENKVNALTDELEKLKNQPKSEEYNGKIVCVENDFPFFKKGDVCHIKDGVFFDSDGYGYHGLGSIESVEELNELLDVKFTELVE